MPRPEIEYIMHRISGDVEGNVRDVKRIMAERHTPDNIPFAPYLTALEYLDDSNPDQRALGMAANREFFEVNTITRVRATGERVSEGMKGELALAYDLAIPVGAEPHLEEEVNKLLPFHMAYIGQRQLPNGQTLLALLNAKPNKDDLVVCYVTDPPASQEEYVAGKRGTIDWYDECFGIKWPDFRNREKLLDTLVQMWLDGKPLQSLAR